MGGQGEGTHMDRRFTKSVTECDGQRKVEIKAAPIQKKLVSSN